MESGLLKKNIFLLLCIALSTLIFSKIIDEKNSQWQRYDSTFIDYDATAGYSIHDYAVRNNNGDFFVASNTPHDLKLKFNFTRSELTRAVVTTHYRDSSCAVNAIGKAHIRFTSNNIDEHFWLEKEGVHSFQLKTVESEPLSISINNEIQAGCGHANISLQSLPQKRLLIVSYFLFWGALCLLLAFTKQSQCITFLVVCIHLISIKVTLAYQALTISSSYWLYGFSLITLGLLLLSKAVRYKWLSNILWLIVISPIVWFFFAFIFYEKKHGQAIDKDAIHALMQSNLIEAWEYLLTQFGTMTFVIYAVAPILLFLAYKLCDRTIKNSNTLILAICLSMFGASMLSIGQSRPPFITKIENSIDSYFYELNRFKSLQKQRQTSEFIGKLNTKSDEQTLIIVIGESANRNHLSAYGYGRNTTPFTQKLIDSEEMLRFDFAYANYTSTNQALSYAFTSADQYSGGKWMSAPSILNVANKANIKTSWITNQQLLGLWDNHVSLIANEAINVVAKNKLTGTARDATKYDEVLIDQLEKTLSDSSNAKLIFVHLQGSHASYCSRYPKDKAIFDGDAVNKAVYGNMAKVIEAKNNGLLNCYDNSIYYTDFILNEIIDTANDKAKPTAVLYFSDHSEDVLRNRAHNNALFTFDMVEIPMLFWSNKKWKESYQNRWSGLKSNQRKDFTNDHLFETILGLAGITSSEINLENDLSSFSYTEKDIKTLHGRKRIKDKENTTYWQRKNLSKIKESKDCTKLLPHRVNTVGKARESIASGACGFEIDLLFENKNGKLFFKVGHDQKTLSGLSLEDFLNQITSTKLVKIWLDIKNLNKQNTQLALVRLNHLGAQFDLKKKALIETSYYQEDIKQIAKAGYQLSYYLPTNLILKAQESDNASKEKLAITLAERVDQMGAKNISFDLRLYGFVKKYLEVSLNQNELSYHSWFPEGLVFSTDTLLEEMPIRPFYKDAKMETILMHYSSPFSL